VRDEPEIEQRKREREHPAKAIAVAGDLPEADGESRDDHQAARPLQREA
jgi:hypothetical protein